MRQWITLCKKECFELWNNKMWIWVPLVFLLLTSMDPITYYFLPEILEYTGGVPEGTIFQIPKMKAEDVILLSLEQLGMFGTLLVAFITMNTIAGERKTGMLEILLAKPISAYSFLLSKSFIYAVLILLSLTVGLTFSAYYINILFSNLSIFTVFGVILFYSVWLVFVISISIFFNSFLRQPTLVLGATITSIVFMHMIKLIYGHELTYLPNNLSDHLKNFIYNGDITNNLIYTTLFTLVMSFLFLFIAIQLFQKTETI